MAGFTLSEWIEETPEVVFNFITDIRNAPRILNGVVRAEPIGNGPVGVGSKFREARVVRGVENATILEVVVHQPPGRFAIKSEQGGVRVTYDYTLRPERGGTRIDLAARVQAAGLKKLLVPLIRNVMKKEDALHLQRLKAVVESESPAAPLPSS